MSMSTKKKVQDKAYAIVPQQCENDSDNYFDKEKQNLRSEEDNKQNMQKEAFLFKLILVIGLAYLTMFPISRFVQDNLMSYDEKEQPANGKDSTHAERHEGKWYHHGHHNGQNKDGWFHHRNRDGDSNRHEDPHKVYPQYLRQSFTNAAPIEEEPKGPKDDPGLSPLGLNGPPPQEPKLGDRQQNVVRDQKDPSKDKPKKDWKKNSKKDWKESKKDWKDPKKDWKDPKEDWKDPKKDWKDPKKDWKDPKKDWKDPKKDWKDPKKDWKDPKKDWKDSKKDWKDSKKDWKDPQKDSKENPKENTKMYSIEEPKQKKMKEMKEKTKAWQEMETPQEHSDYSIEKTKEKTMKESKENTKAWQKKEYTKEGTNEKDSTEANLNADKEEMSLQHVWKTKEAVGKRLGDPMKEALLSRIDQP